MSARWRSGPLTEIARRPISDCIPTTGPQVEAATSRAAVKLLAMAAVMIIDPLTDSAAEDARQRILDLSARTPRYRTGFQLCDLMATRLRETRDKAEGRIH